VRTQLPARDGLKRPLPCPQFFSNTFAPGDSVTLMMANKNEVRLLVTRDALCHCSRRLHVILLVSAVTGYTRRSESVHTSCCVRIMCRCMHAVMRESWRPWVALTSAVRTSPTSRTHCVASHARKLCSGNLRIVLSLVGAPSFNAKQPLPPPMHRPSPVLRSVPALHNASPRTQSHAHTNNPVLTDLWSLLTHPLTSPGVRDGPAGHPHAHDPA
jgi:hypothetical protein